MSTINPTQVIPLDPNKPSRTIGLPSSMGDVITAPTSGNQISYFKRAGDNETYAAQQIHVGVGGNLLCLMLDGYIQGWLGLLNGATVIPKGAIAVVYSATLADGNTYQTTCSNMTWHGGQ